MTTLREAAQQALEALEQAHPKPYNEDVRAHVEAITALRAALEQPEQEPVATVEIVVPEWESIVIKHIPGAPFPTVGSLLYTAPPRRESQGLTGEGEPATELRRLHEVNQELLEVLLEVVPMLEAALMIDGEPEPGSIGHRARAAIAKATGEQA